MYRQVLLVASFLFTVCILPAASQIAEITSGESYRLSGASIPVAAVPSWPAVSGDVVETVGSALSMRFADGSRVVLDANSRAKLIQVGKTAQVELLSGSAAFSLKGDSAVEVVAKTLDSTSQKMREGSVVLDAAGARFAAVSRPVTAPVFRPTPRFLPPVNYLTNPPANPPNTQQGGTPTGSLLPPSVSGSRP